jgi:hypothetical protein
LPRKRKLALADSSCTDTELGGWLRFEEEHGSNFMRAIADAAFLAYTPSYVLLRPTLLRLKEANPRAG